jgi:putative alpha-1,2-mannosidase
LGSPLVKSADIQLPNGKTLRIVAKNQSRKNCYVKSVKLNGKTISTIEISHDQLFSGGLLDFEMTHQPNIKTTNR